MRKKIIVICSVLPLVLAFALFAAFYCQNLVNNYSEQIDLMEQAVQSGDWVQAQALYQDLDEQWARQRPIVQAWINHSDTDNVTLDLIDVRFALLAEDPGKCLLALAKLRESTGHLYHRDALTLSNLL